MAAPVTATGTSRRTTTAALALAALLGGGVIAACGAGSHGGAAAGHSSGFAWLHPQSPPAAWKVARVAGGAQLAYPPGWSPQRGDRGTATAALLGSDGRFIGYLNLTPRQGAETLANWASFRVEHNGEEGDRAVRRLSSAGGLRFLNGHGSCVKDGYMTQTGSRYIEIACLIAGGRAGSVIVGAAPPSSWSSVAGAIERAIEGVRT